jgi:cell division protein FtsA
VFSFALTGEEEGARGRATKAQLSGIIRPRVADILGLVRERMEQAGVSAYAGERVVLTGGSSGLVGLGEFAANTLGRPVRVARPHQVGGLPQGVTSPAFSTVAGLLAVAAAGGEQTGAYGGAEGAGYFGRVGQWLKAGFG